MMAGPTVEIVCVAWLTQGYFNSPKPRSNYGPDGYLRPAISRWSDDGYVNTDVSRE